MFSIKKLDGSVTLVFCYSVSESLQNHNFVLNLKFESFGLDSYYQLPMKNDDAFDTRNSQIECQNEFRVVEIVCMMLFQKSLFSPEMERNDRKWDICSWQ